MEFKYTLGPSAKSAAILVVLVMKNMVERHSTQAIGQINKFGFIRIQYKENKTPQTNVQAIKKPHWIRTIHAGISYGNNVLYIDIFREKIQSVKTFNLKHRYRKFMDIQK